MRLERLEPRDPLAVQEHERHRFGPESALDSGEPGPIAVQDLLAEGDPVLGQELLRARTEAAARPGVDDRLHHLLNLAGKPADGFGMQAWIDTHLPLTGTGWIAVSSVVFMAFVLPWLSRLRLGQRIARLTRAVQHATGGNASALESFEGGGGTRTLAREVRALQRGLTERLSEATKELWSVNDRARAFKEHYDELPVPCFRLGAARRILGVNRAARELFGRGESELLGKDLSTFLARRAQRSKADDIALDVLMPDLGGTGRLVEVERPDGTRTPVLLWGTAVAEAGVGISAESCIALETSGLRDELRRYADDEDRRARHEALEATERLAGRLAEDFEGELTTIIENGRTLVETFEGDEADRMSLEGMTRAAEGIRALGRKLHAFSRRSDSRPEVLAVNDFVRERAERLGEALGADVRLETKLADDADGVYFDPEQLEETLVQLVANASQAAGRRGHVTIETEVVADAPKHALGLEDERRAGPWLRLTVHDDGRGMDRRTLARVFEPFYSGKSPLGAPPATERARSGLGLSAVHGMVAQNGGLISIESELARGTTVRLWLPHVVREPAVARTANDGSGGRTVLFVASDLEARRRGASVLRDEGFSVRTASDAPVALGLLRAGEESFDLIVVESVRSHAGTTLRDELLTEFPELDLLLLVEPDDDTLAHEAGSGLHVLRAPFTPSELARTVRTILDGPTAVETAPRSRRILVIDETEAVRTLLRSFLESLGHDFHLASGGDDAFYELERTDFDVVLGDVLALAQEDFATRFPRVKVIAMSEDDGTSSDPGEVCATLRKPFSKDELEAALEKARAV